MGSEYDPLFGRRAVPAAEAEAFEAIQARFRRAGRPYLSSPWPWLAWGLCLPTAAWLTPAAVARRGFAGVLLLWSLTILVAGGLEAWTLWRAGAGGSPLASWALHVQGNLSLIALALTVLLVVRDLPLALPGLWLLVLGHSFYSLGGLSFPALRRYGLAYQLGGAAALLAERQALAVFAATTLLANLGLALFVALRGREEAGCA